MTFAPCATCGKHPYPIYLTLSEVIERFKISRSTLYEWIKSEGFPEPDHLGKNTARWIEEEVYAWSRARRQAS